LASYDSKTALKHSLKDLLEPLGNSLRKQPVKNQLLTIIEEGRLFETLNSHPQGPQYRANLIKLIGLAEEFEALQPETLNAMGIAGKNASTFPVWLNENKDSIDEQPTADPQAEDAVVLKTWHSSKGLEWPVVMVLDAEKASEPRFPSISMAYPDGDIETMLKESFVQILPKFDDYFNKERFRSILFKDQASTNSNLYYVALTRAREQIVLPHWEEYRDGSMQSFLRPELENLAGMGDQSVYSEKFIGPGDADLSAQARMGASSRTTLLINQHLLGKKVNYTFNPSLSKEPVEVAVTEVEKTIYAPPLDLNFYAASSAHKLGLWVHRLYQVYLMQPKLLRKALLMQPVCVSDEGELQEITAHLEGFKRHVEVLTGGVAYWECEIPVTGLQLNGQVISGQVDTLAKSEAGWTLIDHKTDTNASAKNHIGQLLTYLHLCDPSENCSLAINWTRLGEIEVVAG